MTWLGITALLSYWRANPWQLITLIAGLALATALWSGVQAINAEARASYDTAADVVSGTGLRQIRRADGAALSTADYVALRRAGWQVSPVLEGQLRLEGKSLYLVGLEPLTLPQAVAGSGAETSGSFAQSDLFASPDTVIGHPEDAALFDNLAVTVRAEESQTQGRALTDIATAQRLLGTPDQITRLIVDVAQPLGLPSLPDTYDMSQPAPQNDVARLTESFHLNLTAFGLLSFAVGIFIVYGAVGLAFEQRRAVFRTLRALGVPLRSLMVLLALELGVFALVACVLLVAGLGFAVWGQGLFAGFALLACLLIGAALLLPLLLGGALHLAGRLHQGALAEWFWADSRQQLPGLSMALMALLLAMAANIGVSTMVSSFRLTFTGYLDQRLASELYLNARSPAQADAMTAYLEAQGVTVLPIISEDLRIAELPAEIFGVRDHPTYRENWPVLAALPEAWDRLAAGEGAFINEQLARRNDLAPGDILDSGDLILGIYSDYGNSAGQAVISQTQFAERFPRRQALRFGLRTQNPAAVADDLRQRFNLAGDALINQADLKAFSLSVFERTFSVTAALNLLTLSVAGLAILISLLTLASLRLPQLAPVWALGLTRRHLATLELLRAVCLAAATGLLAIPLGLALAWVLLTVLNVEAFGWRLPMFLFPGAYFKLGMLTLLAALMAALWPAVRLARTPPDRLLRVFRNER